MQINDVYIKVLKHYGKKNQLNKAIEELKELRDEINKAIKHNFYHKENITNEIADVVNMIKQLQIIYKIDSKDIDKARRAKMERTLKRIKEEQNNVNE